MMSVASVIGVIVVLLLAGYLLSYRIPEYAPSAPVVLLASAPDDASLPGENNSDRLTIDTADLPFAFNVVNKNGDKLLGTMDVEDADSGLQVVVMDVETGVSRIVPLSTGVTIEATTFVLSFSIVNSRITVFVKEV